MSNGEPTSDQSIPYANQLKKPLIQTGQWVEPFRLPDPRAIFRIMGIKKFSGENRGEQTPMVLISGGTHRIPFGDYSDSTQASSEVTRGSLVIRRQSKRLLNQRMVSGI
mgnify:CR=1 FL=1